MKKRIVTLLLSAVMVVGSFTGCSSDNGGGTGGSEASGETGKKENTGDDSNSGEKVKLKALACTHTLTKDLDDIQFLKDIADEAGVEIEWEQIRADWDTVKSTRFASGDIPDLLFAATSSADYVQYNGLFMDMTNLISKESTPNIAEMFEEEPDTKILAQTLEGKIYATPKFQGKWPKTNTVMFINQEWLDNLGLKQPTTLSELKDVLIAFRDEDANGNGNPDDEIPLDFNCKGSNAWFNSAYSLTNLLGSYGIQLTNWGFESYFAEEGKIKAYAIDERYKEFMEYAADLWSEGLINPNVITNDYSAFQSLSRGDENGDAVVGVTFGWEETDKFGPELHSQYKPLAPLVCDVGENADTYDTRWRDDYTGLNMDGNRVAMSAKCSNPEAAMRFIDKLYDADVSVQVLFGGIPDGCVEKTGDNSFKVLPPLDPDTDPGTWKWTNGFADMGCMYIRRDTEIEMAEDMQFALEERTVYDEALAKVTEDDTYPQFFMKYSEADENTMAMNQANVNNIIDNQWSLWMTGEQDIDSTWDDYVANVKSAGLDEILKIRQKAYDTYRESAN